MEMKIIAVALLAILFEVGGKADAIKETDDSLSLSYDRAATCEDKKSERWCDRRCYNERKCRKKKACQKKCMDWCDMCPEEPETPTTTTAPTDTPSTAAPTVAPTTTTSAPGPGPVTGNGYIQAWLRGDQVGDRDQAHVHEGLRLADRSGWVGVGGTICDNCARQVMVRRIDNEGNTVWTALFGAGGNTGRSVGFAVVQDPNNADRLYVGAGLWQGGKMRPAVLALDASTGRQVWAWTTTSHAQHGGVRGVIVDGSRIIAAGYVKSPQAGFLFVADDASPGVWELDTSGNLVKEKLLSRDILPQGAKIRKDLSSGFVLSSTAWKEIGNKEVNAVAVVKLTDALEVEWNKKFALASGNSQMFDIAVDDEGNYIVVGHTTAGAGVVNWDYLALKVGPTGNEIWRKTFGQPRGFDARYIHDECYGVQIDAAGNYLLMGGSGDEYGQYSVTNSDGWSSDIWVSYLVVLDKQGSKLFEGVYGDKGSNNAGEYLSVDTASGELMNYVDSDYLGGGFGFMKLSPVAT